MKNLIKQFYNEGLANIFYKRPVNYLNKKIKNKTLVKILSFIMKIIYTVLVLLFAAVIFYKKIK